MSLINLNEFTHHLINHHQLSFMLDKRRKLLSSKKKKKKLLLASRMPAIPRNKDQQDGELLLLS